MLVYHSPTSSFTAANQTFTSSMYLAPPKIVRFDFLTTSMKSWSYHIMTSRATQHVERSPIGQPLFWR